MSAPFELPGFDILEKLGEGGMATVWKARQRSLDRIVAIKVLSSVLTEDVEDVERFQSEARSAAKLKDQGIVQVYDADAYNGMYYFVMEYVAGYSVGDWIRRSGIIEETDILLVAEAVAAALGHAWEKEAIVHCDIKPDNVMIDGDGTVKVADLGLARSISAVGAEDVEEIMGTPAYISPEQATGSDSLDLRADMYSLGAMMYHMATAETMFAGSGNTEVMEGQVNDTLGDVLDRNPDLSQGFCWLLEKLLMKDVEDRPADWGEVLEDLNQVKQGGLPTGPAPLENLSTMRRSSKRHRNVSIPVDTVPERKSALPLILSLGGAVVVLLIIVVALSAKGRKPQVIYKPIAGPGAAQPGTPGQDTAAARKQRKEKLAQEMYDYARSWSRENPDQYTESIGKYEKVAAAGRGTKYELMARDQISGIRRKMIKVLQDTRASLDKQITTHVAENDYDQALDLARNYDGVFARGLARFLKEKEAWILQEKTAFESSSEAVESKREVAAKEAMDKAVEAILAGNLMLAGRCIDDGIHNVEDGPSFKKLSQVQQVLSAAGRTDALLYNSFSRQAGTVVTVDFAKPRQQKLKVMIEEVSAPVVRYKVKVTATAFIERSFKLPDLTPGERFKRFAAARRDSEPGVALQMGIEARRANAESHARRYFSKVPIIGKLLTAGMDVGSVTSQATESPGNDSGPEGATKGAATEYTNFLRREGFAVQNDPENWHKVIGSQPVSHAAATAALKKLPEFRKRVSMLEDYVDIAESVDFLEERLREPKKTSRPPPAHRGPVFNEAQLRASLSAVNSGLEHEELWIKQGRDGTVTSVVIRSENIKDIGPLANVPGLKHLEIDGQGRRSSKARNLQASLKDLSPLKNLRLESLELRNTQVDDLRFMKDMNIERIELIHNRLRDLRALSTQYPEEFVLQHTKIRDFNGIKHMNLVHVDVSDTGLTDLKVFAGMPLEHLAVANTGVRDLKPLRDAPLQRLDLEGTKVSDISPIAEAPLEYLNLEGTDVKNLAPLEGMPLNHLKAGGLNIADLSMLEGMEIRHLDISGSTANDLTFLGEFPLVALSADRTRLDDLDFLRGKRMVHLSVNDTGIDDLSPLEGMPLRYLSINDTKVGSLAPVARSPLEFLSCRSAPIGDIHLLTEMPIEHLHYTHKAHAMRNVLSRMRNLRSYNGSYNWMD